MPGAFEKRRTVAYIRVSTSSEEQLNSYEAQKDYFTETLTPIAPSVWAYFRHMSGKKIFAAAAQMTAEEVLFTINYRPDITPTHVIRYKGTLYDITRVDTCEGYREDLTLYCRRR